MNAYSERASAASMLRLMRPLRVQREALAYLMSVVGTAALVGGFLPYRDDVEPLTKAFGFLLVVVVTAALGGIWPGVFASVLGFIAFNFFFLPPYDTFAIGKPEYVVVLFVNLGLSVLISLLIGRASERATAAETREVELRTLQGLSRELVVRGPGTDAYREIVGLVLDTFGYESGALFVRDAANVGGLREEVSVGCNPGDIVPEWDPRSPERAPERLPLSVGSNNVGLLVLKGSRDAPTDAESRIMRAFGDQLALVLERDRLLRVATDAEVYRQTERLRQTLLAAVSHDLRSPLAAIKASVTDLLADDDVERTSAELREALEAIDSESERLNALIANLLDMSRIEAGVLQARAEAIDLGDVISASVDNVNRVWPHVRIREGVQEGLFARADPVFLDRILTNLLDNAARSSRGASDVEVTTRRNHGLVTIRVIDHGNGITPEARELLFHPFYELDRRNPRLGSGLGLAIAKGFVAAMDGEIWVEDTPGGGSTFAVAVPAGPVA